MKKAILLTAVLALLTVGTTAQNPSAKPPDGESMEAREARIRDEIRLLESQIKYLPQCRNQRFVKTPA